MTGIELATHVDQGIRPIVLLLNNGGYGMLEAIDRPHAYYEPQELGLPRPGQVAGCRGRELRQPTRLNSQRRCNAPRTQRAYPIEALHQPR